MSQFCFCFKFARSVTQHHDKSTDYPSPTCTHLCPVGTLKHKVWLPSLLYLYFLLVYTTGLLADQAFTNMGLRMHWWLYWKDHFTWSGPCTVSVGEGVVFSFSCFLACLFAYMLCFLVCLFACLFTFFSFVFYSTLALLCSLISSFARFVRSLIGMKPCMTLEMNWVKYKRDCTTITTWLSIILPLYDELVTFSPWYVEGKYILFDVNLGENTMLAC